MSLRLIIWQNVERGSAGGYEGPAGKLGANRNSSYSSDTLICSLHLHTVLVFFWGGAQCGKVWCDVDPQRTRFYFSGFFTSVPILVKIDREMRPFLRNLVALPCETWKFKNVAIALYNSRWRSCVELLWQLCKLLTDLKNTFYEFGIMLHCFNDYSFN